MKLTLAIVTDPTLQILMDGGFAIIGTATMQGSCDAVATGKKVLQDMSIGVTIGST